MQVDAFNPLLSLANAFKQGSIYPYYQCIVAAGLERRPHIIQLLQNHRFSLGRIHKDAVLGYLP